MEAAFIPEVNDELDTQNFEKFDEVFTFFKLLLILCCKLLKIVHICKKKYSHFTFITYAV